MLKKSFLMLIVVLIVLASLPLNVFADDDSHDFEWQHNGIVDENLELLSGGIRGKKTAKATDNPNEYLIEIEIESLMQSSERDKALLFLIDNSVGNPIEDYKTTITNIIENIMTANSSYKIAIATINGNYTNVTPFLEDKEQLINPLSEINSVGNCYLDDGIRKARESLLSSNCQELNLIVFSKGTPGYSSKVKSIETSVVCSDNHMAQNWIIKPTYVEPKERISSLNFNQQTIPRTVCQLGREERTSLKYPNNHSETAIYEAKVSTNSGIKIYSTGFNLNSTEQKTLENIQNSGFFADQKSIINNITDIFKSPKFVDFSKLEVIDNTNNLGTIKQDSVKSSTGSTSLTENAITWEFSEKGKLSYLFVWNVELPEFKSDILIDTGKTTTLEYQNGENTEQIFLKQPKGSGKYHKIFARGVLVNTEKQLINTEGDIVDVPEQAYKTSELIDINNDFGVNQWKPRSSILVYGNNIPKNSEYLSANEENFNYTLNLTDDNENPIVYFPFIRNKFSYTVEYYYIDEDISFDQIEIYTTFNSEITNIPESDDLKEGFELKSIENLPATIKDNNIVIKAFYNKKEEQENNIEYKIEYFKDGVLFFSESQYTNDGVVNLQDLRIEENNPKGYLFIDAVFKDEKITQNILVDKDENIINVNYSKGLDYQVTFYKNGDETFKINDLVLVNDPILNTKKLIDKYSDDLVGYNPERTVINNTELDGIPNEITITLIENKIKLYFVKPEKTINYTVNYHKGNQVESKDYTITDSYIIFSPDENYYYSDGYLYHKSEFYGEELAKDQIINISDQENVIDIYYVPDATLVDVVITYVVNGKDYLVWEIKGNASEWITYATVSENVPEGYTMVTDPSLTNPVLMRDNRRITVYCNPSSSTTLPYTISYYKKSEQNSYEIIPDKTRYERVPASSPYFTIEYEDAFEENESGKIKIDKIDFLQPDKADREITIGEQVEVLWGRNEVNIFYSEEEENTGGTGSGENLKPPNPPDTEKPNPENPGNPNNPEPENPVKPIDPVDGTVDITIKAYYYDKETKVEWKELEVFKLNQSVNLWSKFSENNYQGVKLSLNSLTVKEFYTENQKLLTLGYSEDNFKENSVKVNEFIVGNDDSFIFTKNKTYELILMYSQISQEPQKPSEKSDETNNSNTITRVGSNFRSSNFKGSGLDKNSIIPKASKEEIKPKELTEETKKKDVTNYGGIGYLLPITGQSKHLIHQTDTFKMVVFENLLLTHYVTMLSDRNFKKDK